MPNIYEVEQTTHESELGSKMIKGEGNDKGKVEDMGVIG